MTPRKLNVTQTRLLIELPHGTVLAQDDFQAEQLAAWTQHKTPAKAKSTNAGFLSVPALVTTAEAGTLSSPHWRN